MPPENKPEKAIDQLLAMEPSTAEIPGPLMEEEEAPTPSITTELKPVLEQNTRLSEVLEKLNQQVTNPPADSQSARLLADPMIREYLSLKAAGKEVRLLPAEAVKQPEPTPDPDFETMTNGELMKYMISKVSELTDTRAKSIAESEVSRLRDQVTPHLNAVVAHTAESEQLRVKSQIEAAKAAHPDFDQMRPKMVELNKSTPGLSVEELYVLAKVRSGLPLISQNELATERPSVLPGNRERYSRPKDTNGSAGFERLMDAALSTRDR
jgi:hypothetical protein